MLTEELHAIEPTTGQTSARNRADPHVAPSPSPQLINATERNNKKPETICTVLASELNPRSIAQWPRDFMLSTIRAGHVLATFRQIRFQDIVASILNSCLLFTFAAVFSSAIFGDIGLSQYVALGTGCNLISTVLLQGAFALFSDAGVSICGPDINPTIFLATMAGIAREAMIFNLEQAALERDNNNNGATTPSPSISSHRLLRDPITSMPTSFDGSELLNPEKLLSTVLVLIILTSVVFGVFCYILGRLKVSRGIQLVPGSVLAGFMASVGYLVVAKAVKTSMPHDTYHHGWTDPMFWAFCLPAVPIGVCMYLQKRWHVGSTVVLVPLILALPLATFFICVYASGSDVERVRQLGWLFPQFESEVFYNQFVDSYGRPDYVDWYAIQSTVPTMFVMWFIITVDTLLKQAALRKMLKLPDMRIDHELMLMGKTNVLVGMCVGVAGYPQPKLVSINVGILQNNTSRVSGLLVCFFNAILFLTGFPLINYLPRFWLSGVLIFAAMGFLVENLWDSRKTFSRKEYASIWAIVLINALFSMAWAVLAGIVLSALIFAMAYSRGGSIKSIISGSNYRSSVLRSFQDDSKLEHVGSKALVIQLHRYVFFGSAAFLNEMIVGLIKEQEVRGELVQRANLFLFDWTHVEDVDVTALGVIGELMLKLCTRERIVLFSGVSSRLRTKLSDGDNILQLIYEPEFQASVRLSKSCQEDAMHGIVGKHRRCFDTLDRGMEFMEELLLERANEVRENWFHLMDSFHAFSLQMCVPNAVWDHDMEPYIRVMPLTKGSFLCEKDSVDSNLYVLQEGSLTVFVHPTEEDMEEDGKPRASRLQTLKPGSFFNEDALLCQEDLQRMPYSVVADMDSTVLVLDREGMIRLERQQPALFLQVHRKVLRHSSRTKQKIVRMLGSLHLLDNELTHQREDVLEMNSPLRLVEEESVDVESGPMAPNPNAAVGVESRPSISIHPAVGLLDSATNKAMGAIKGTAKVVKEMSHVPVAALNSGLILSGLRDEREDLVRPDGEDLLDTDQLREGAGEEDGRRLAKLMISSKRRMIARASSAPTSPTKRTVKDFRKGHNAKDSSNSASIASEEVLEALWQLREIMPPSTAVFDFELRLSNVQQAKAMYLFSKHQLHGAVTSSLLSEMLGEIGLLWKVPDILVSPPTCAETDFLKLALDLSMKDLSTQELDQLMALYQHVGDWTQRSVHAHFDHLSSSAISSFFKLWATKEGRIDFSGLCSAVSQYLKVLEWDEQVESDWTKVSGGRELVVAEDLVHFLGTDKLSLAQEMIWEAEYEHSHALTLTDLLQTLSCHHHHHKI